MLCGDLGLIYYQCIRQIGGPDSGGRLDRQCVKVVIEGGPDSLPAFEHHVAFFEQSHDDRSKLLLAGSIALARQRPNSLGQYHVGDQYRFLRLKQPTGSLGLRRIVVQQSPQKDVGVDGNHAARLLAVTFARLLASASRNDSSSENRVSALRCLST